MLDLVKPETRIRIASARRTAYCGNVGEAIAALEHYRETASMPQVDLASILSTKAELLFLDGKLAGAHQTFDSELEPMLNSLPHKVAVAIELNRVDVASALFDSQGISRAYDLFDEMRIAGIKHRDHPALLLRSHFKVACALIQKASDAVPDDLVDRLVRWVLPRCGSENEPEDHGACERVAWKTIEALASRCSEVTAQEIVTAATGHRAWSAGRISQGSRGLS